MSIYKLLDEREERARFQASLCTEYGLPVAVIRANIPGEKKVYTESLWISYEIFLQCKESFGKYICKVFHRFSSEGLIFFLVLKCSGEEAKKIAVQIEETHFLGRLVDLDIIEKDKFFSRGNNLRKCFLCGKPAIICSRAKTHPLEEITAFIKKKVYSRWLVKSSANENGKNKILHTLAVLSEASMLSELCRSFGLGCVTANSCGSHTDMDFQLMLKCLPFMRSVILNLTEDICSDFTLLRSYGKECEKKLSALTGGVNTYKGALFLLLILNACAYRLIRAEKPFKLLSAEIASFSLPLNSDFENGLYSPASAKLFEEKKVLGVRNLVLTGFAEHFNLWLPLFKKEEDIKMLQAKIAAVTWDSTIVKRKGLQTLLTFKEQCASVSCKEDLEKLENFCKTENISSGGTADKIIILYNLYLLEDFFKLL